MQDRDYHEHQIALVERRAAEAAVVAVTPDMIELDADEAYLLGAVRDLPQTVRGNSYEWGEERRSVFHVVCTDLMRGGLLEFDRLAARLAVTATGLEVLRLHREREAARKAAEPIMLPIPPALVDNAAVALRHGCWQWSAEEARPILELRDQLLALKEARK